MDHVAQIVTQNPDLKFRNTSYDSFANGVEISDDGHTATLWIDDTDADVEVTGTSADGQEVVVAINTNGEYGSGPYVLVRNAPVGTNRITGFEGIEAFIYA